MPRFAANLSTMYAEHPALDRLAAAARDGFEATECLFPYDHPALEWRRRLDEYDLCQALFNAPPGDWAAGERGLASLPGREREFQDSILEAFEFSRVIHNRVIHVMAGSIAEGEDRAERRATYVKNLAWAAAEAAQVGFTLTIEPINPGDTPGYFLQHQAEAHGIVQEVGSRHLKVQLDFYHCQIVDGDPAGHYRRGRERIGHVQVAGVPGRHEPDEGEIDPEPLFEMLDHLGYSGWVGLEYRPRGDTTRGLKWALPWLDSRFR